MNRFYLVVIFLVSFQSIVASNTFFIVIIAAYNNKNWCKKAIESVLDQQYTHFHLIYVDDASDDGATEIALSVLQRYPSLLWTFYKNDKNRGALYNYYHAIHRSKDTNVIVMVDGDDWLAHPYVLSRLDKTYQDENVWVTYGQYRTTNSDYKSHCKKYPQDIIKARRFRQHPWRVGHPRTFYAWLFKKIIVEDLYYDGNFAPVAWDLFIMFPLLEMAGERHRFIRDVLYVYNIENPLSDFVKNPDLQIALSFYCKKQNPYEYLL